MQPRSMLLKALEKSSRRVQRSPDLVDGSSNTLETEWTMASHPILTPTPTWRGERVEIDSSWTARDRHFDVRRRRTSPTAMGRRLTTLLLASEEGGTTEVWDNFLWGVASNYEPHHPQKSLDCLGSTVCAVTATCRSRTAMHGPAHQLAVRMRIISNN